MGAGRNLMGKIHMRVRRRLWQAQGTNPLTALRSRVRWLVVSDSILDKAEIIRGLQTGFPKGWDPAALHWNGGNTRNLVENVEGWFQGLPTNEIRVDIIPQSIRAER